MTAIEVRAPGKLFVIGEYAVLHGARALVAAVEAGVCCRIEDEAAWRIVAPDLGVAGTIEELSRHPGGALLAEAVSAARDEFVLDRPFCFTVRGTDEASRRKRGLGGSAASVVAILAAAGAAAGLDLRAKKARARLFARALSVHRQHQRGRGSGADVAASVYGGWLDYSLAEGGPRIAEATLPRGFALAAAWSGVASDTARAIDAFEPMALLPRLRVILGDFWAAVDAGNRSRMLSAIDAYGGALEGLAGDSAGVRAIAKLVAAARGPAIAAKGSGAVGGDSAIAVGFDRAELSAVENRWRAERAQPLSVAIDVRGVRQEDGHA